MTSLTGTLGTLIDLLTVVLGFGLIVFLHELGHFLAARWAGIRVQAFAVGMGPAIFSYRKGMGVTQGSSEAAYNELVRAAVGEAGDAREDARRKLSGEVSPTEYRLNALPLGGYVKMLGQDDMDPSSVSDAPDSYQNATVPKRMVVISAGVLVNLITAAFMFMFVFLVGRDVEPAVIGSVRPDSPAATAQVLNAAEVGLPTDAAGLEVGDRVLSVDGDTPRDFNELALMVAMAGRDAVLPVEIERPGVAEPLRFEITPEKDEVTRLLSLGVLPAQSLELVSPQNATERAEYRDLLDSLGLQDVPLGSTLIAAGGRDLTYFGELDALFDSSAPVNATFETPEGERIDTEIPSRPARFFDEIAAPEGSVAVQHLFGMQGLLMVNLSSGAEPRQGLERGDLLTRVGDIAFPSYDEAFAAIRANAGRPLTLEVLHDGAVVSLDVKVGRDGRIGFTAQDAFEHTNITAAIPERVRPLDGGPWREPPALGVIGSAGTRIVSVAGEPTATLADVREQILQAGPGEIELGLEVPLTDADGEPVRETATLSLSEDDFDRLVERGYTPPLGFSTSFELTTTTLRAEGPIEAVAFGLRDTKNMVVRTYLTIARLFDGTVQVTHLRGPVGIAHVGTLIADRGPIWLIWFFALISVNLAVINFLPLPIVDGGQFLMLCYEGLRGKPVPIAVQSAVTLAGLLMIATMFLVLTFNDVRNLLGV
ncbi:MAG: site-2 protease family protein [Planctomycetota bacterium]